MKKDADGIYECLLNNTLKGSITELVEMSIKIKSIISKASKSDTCSKKSSSSKGSGFSISLVKNMEGQNNKDEARISLNSLNSVKTSNTSLIVDSEQVSKLESIYFKYKNVFSLKDSRDFLVILNKLKFNK